MKIRCGSSSTPQINGCWLAHMAIGCIDLSFR